MISQNTTPFRKLIWYKQVLGGHIPSVEKTVSGALIHVMDALAKYAKNLSVSIEPVQSGSGDPSPENIRPITGHTGVNVVRTGKNLANYTNGTNNVVIMRCKANQTYIISMTYTMGSATSCGFALKKNNNSGSTIASYASSTDGRKSKSFTPDEDCDLFLNGYGTGATFSSIVSDLQVELGSSATDYEAYQGTTYSVTFPAVGSNLFNGSYGSANKQPIPLGTTELTVSGKSNGEYKLSLRFYNSSGTKTGTDIVIIDVGETSGTKVITSYLPSDATTFIMFSPNSGSILGFSDVEVYSNVIYGGTLELTTGVLTVDKRIIDLSTVSFTERYTGSVNKTLRGELNPPFPYIETSQDVSGFTAEKYKGIGTVSSASTLSSPDEKDVGLYAYRKSDEPNAGVIYIVTPLTDTPTGSLVYKVAPTTNQLTPTQVKLLLGENCIWADTGDSELTYLAEA